MKKIIGVLTLTITSIVLLGGFASANMGYSNTSWNSHMGAKWTNNHWNQWSHHNNYWKQNQYNQGFNVGYNAGRNAGYAAGYGRGLSNGSYKAQSGMLKTINNNTYNAGYRAGYNAGFHSGYGAGYGAGIAQYWRIHNNLWWVN